MKVFKFGGASVKDVAGVQNVAKIIESHPANHLVVVVSAMGKMTNAFETLVDAYTGGSDEMVTQLAEIRGYHEAIASGLDGANEIKNTLDPVFGQLESRLQRSPSDNYDFDYDQIVSFGEVLSTIIIAHYLNAKGLNCHWTDARRMI
ncbi:MAG TPA: hypothetical protein VJ894_04030, partial [Cryomorphaceae bacterium]|nr:hypothetical protein [Cryomorphaceae bacterium]